MENKKNINAKLLEFQKLNISVKKDGKNPHFKSSYPTLNEVLDKVKKPLNDLGILIMFVPESDGLRTILLDVESETKLEGFMKYVSCDNAQKLLACNTYFRRGTLVSLLGLEDEDDDGNIASIPVKKEEKFILEPIEKIKECLSVKQLTDLYNQMPANQQKAEHIIEAFKNQKKLFKK